MSEVFIGRRRELAALDEAYRGPGSALIPVYGRRRVGKSELLLRFLAGKPGLYFLGRQAPAELQRREFLREAALALGEPLLASFPADNWAAALEAVVSRWRGRGKFILVLDEFQWTAQASPELPSVLQGLWDRRWRRAGKVFLALCGSFVGFMEREVLGRQSPLFGRRTAQVHLQPFGYREAAEFHPAYSPADRARAYFLCGGIPLYLRFFDQARSVEENIRHALLDEFGPLFREPEFLLREELREVESYAAVLQAVAAGARSTGDIARQSGIAQRSLPYYLEQLAGLGYLARRRPLGGGKPNTRLVHFVLEDPLLRFWFRFVFPNTSFLLRHGAQKTLAERIRPQLGAYFGLGFARLCREALPDLYAREGIAAPAAVGEYWDRERQVDLVAVREDNWIDLGECRWGAPGPAGRLLAELEAKAARFPNPRGATLGLRFFTRRPLPRPPASARPARWHSLNDLYG